MTNLVRSDQPSIRRTEAGIELISGYSVYGKCFEFPPNSYVELGGTWLEKPLPQTGQLYSYTVMHPKDAPPYGLAFVDFEGGVRVFGRLQVDSGRPLRLGSSITVCEAPAEAGSQYIFVPAEQGVLK